MGEVVSIALWGALVLILVTGDSPNLGVERALRSAGRSAALSDSLDCGLRTRHMVIWDTVRTHHQQPRYGHVNRGV